MDYGAIIAHFYGLDWRHLTYRQFFGLLNRFNKISTMEKNADWNTEDVVSEMEYKRKGL